MRKSFTIKNIAKTAIFSVIIVIFRIFAVQKLILRGMKFLGNILWLVFGGIIIAIIYYIVGLMMCITIIGIPFGVQLFKLGTYALWPFGRDLVNGPNEPGCVSVLMNLIWILCGWWEIAILHFTFGLLFCLTIVGIPWGLQHFKMAIATVFPFGKTIRRV